MTGQLVRLLKAHYQIGAGREGIISGRNGQGWLAVFGSVAITLLFEGEGVTYKFV